MDILFLSPSDAAWTETLKQCRHDIYHLPDYAALEAERQNGKPLGALAQDGDSRLLIPFILLPMQIGGEVSPSLAGAWDATSPYGYPSPLVIAGPEIAEAFLDKALRALKEEMRVQRVASGFVRMHPLLNNLDAIFARHGSIVEHGETIWIDLTKTDDEIWRQTRKQTRNAVNRLTKQGLTARMDTEFRHYDFFQKTYYKTMNKANAADWYYFDAAYFTRLRNALGERLSLGVVEDETGRMCAGALFTETGGLVQYHIAATNPDLPHREAMKLLLHFARTWFKTRGNHAMHLGGGLGAERDSLFLFKSGFSKERANFHTWRSVFNEDLYRHAQSLWETKTGKTVKGMDSFFPPYRQAY